MKLLCKWCVLISAYIKKTINFVEMYDCKRLQERLSPLI